MAVPETLKLRRVRFTRKVRAMLLSFTDDPAVVGWYRRQIEADRFFALGVFDGWRMVGVVVLQFADGAHGRVLTVLVGAGRAPGVDLTSSVMPALERLAAADGCATMRFETARRALVRRTALIGYTFGCAVMEKDLRHGV